MSEERISSRRLPPTIGDLNRRIRREQQMAMLETAVDGDSLRLHRSRVPRVTRGRTAESVNDQHDDDDGDLDEIIVVSLNDST